jgi:hypothetical protein
MSEYNGQVFQDMFVEKITNKKNGTFLEIGSHHPIVSNNTYILEKKHNWKGIMVEYLTEFEPLYKNTRPNSIHIIKDARHVNYREILDANFNENIDYLQLDLDVDNNSTMDTLNLLNRTVFDKFKFATVTFEHDIYTGDYFNTRQASRQIFKDRGYILTFPDVKVFFNNSYSPFEDWYIHPDLISSEIINKCKTSHSLNKEQIKHILDSI